MTVMGGIIASPKRRHFAGLSYSSLRNEPSANVRLQILNMVHASFTIGRDQYHSDVIEHLEENPDVVQRLRARLDEVSRLRSEDLGFEAPSPDAFDVINQIVSHAAKQAQPSDRLEVGADEGGYLDLILMRGLETASISTTGHNDIDVRWIPSKGPMTRLAATSPQAAVKALFSAPPKRGR